MQPPDELMTGTFLPAMRQLVARRLRSQGMSQNRISGILGITQASVSLYLSSDAERAYAQLSKFSLGREEADADSSVLAEAASRSPEDGVAALYSVWTRMLGDGSACGLHRGMYPSLAGCDVCIKEYGSRIGTRSDAIAEVSEAVRLLERSPRFVAAMPEVSVNIACAAGDATSQADVVAVPGRIVKVKDRAKAMLPPEAGASAHMSKMLLIARRRRPDVRACINLRYDARMARVLKRLRIRTISIGDYPAGGSDSTAGALEAKLATTTRPFDAVVDEGGSGIEPNLYLFAEGARKAAELAVRVAGAYSAA